MFGKSQESRSGGAYKILFDNAPSRVLLDAERHGSSGKESMFKIGDEFVMGTMGTGRGNSVFVTIPESFLSEHNIDSEVFSKYTNDGIEYVMDNRQLMEFSIGFLEKWGKNPNPILGDLVSKEKKTDHFPAIQHTISLSDLNDSQRSAIQKALQQRVTFLWGPPGTGKTKTLGALTSALVNSGKRVLLCALSNNAVDQVLMNVVGRVDVQKTGIARLGPSMDRTLLPFSKEAFENGSFRSKRLGIGWKDHIQSAPIVAANFTYLTLPRLPWLGKFDYVIADEVSMASIPSLAIASFFATTGVVLGGDPNQLPPIFPEDSEEPNVWFKENIFHHAGIGDMAVADERMAFLDTQYRMHPKIGDLVSKMFYKSTLKTGVIPSAAVKEPTPWHDKNVIFLHSKGKVEILAGAIGKDAEHKKINNAHAAIIAKEVSDLVSQGVSPENIGIIAPYNSQVANIVKHLKGKGVPNNVKVSTVHSFQGQERPIIIVDFTDDDCDPTHLTAKWQLVNVALSRAKEVLMLVGNREYLLNDVYFSVAEVSMFKSMLEGSHVIELPTAK